MEIDKCRELKPIPRAGPLKYLSINQLAGLCWSWMRLVCQLDPFQ